MEGLKALLGWRFAASAVLGFGVAAWVYYSRGQAGVNVWALGRVVVVTLLAGLVWEIATMRARCGFRPDK
jgi:hypothetical protein